MQPINEGNRHVDEGLWKERALRKTGKMISTMKFRLYTLLLFSWGVSVQSCNNGKTIESSSWQDVPIMSNDSLIELNEKRWYPKPVPFSVGMMTDIGSDGDGAREVTIDMKIAWNKENMATVRVWMGSELVVKDASLPIYHSRHIDGDGTIRQIFDWVLGALPDDIEPDGIAKRATERDIVANRTQSDKDFGDWVYNIMGEMINWQKEEIVTRWKKATWYTGSIIEIEFQEMENPKTGDKMIYFIRKKWSNPAKVGIRL